ncbi:MAG: tRNA adenosine(34) deaminase TadA [Endomicrobiia bacterium]
MKNWSQKNKYFMSQALKEAHKAYKKCEVPVGAVVVKNNKIISKGYNSNITTNDPSAHAEIVAIKKAAKKLKNYRLNDCEIYVTLEPCPMCAGAMVYARIKKLFYAVEDPKSGACKSVFNIVNNKKLNHRIDVESGLCREEAKRLLQKFFRERR